MSSIESRSRRARKTRARLKVQRAIRLTIHRSNCHIYAQIISEDGSRVLASASTAEAELRTQVGNGGNVAAAAQVGKRIAEKAKQIGVNQVAFDRSGFRYHGRVKALADAAREGGLAF